MRYFYRIFLCLGMAVALILLPIIEQSQAATTTSQPMSATEFFKLGVDSTQQEKYEEALENFTQAIQLEPDFAAAYSNRCLVHIQLQDYEKAIQDCTQTLELNSNNSEAYLNRGLAYYRSANYEAAIPDYTQAIELQSDDFRAYYNRGLVRFELKDYTGAIADYNQALLNRQQHPGILLAEVYNDRGLAKLMLENIPDAIADFSQAINLDDRNYRSFYNRACACHRNQDYNGAIRDFTFALQLDPNHAEAYVSRAIIHNEVGLQQAALSDLKAASKCFNQQGNIAEYQHTLALIERLQKLLQLFNESEFS